MNNAMCMKFEKTDTNLSSDSNSSEHIQYDTGAEQLSEGSALDELHDDIRRVRRPAETVTAAHIRVSDGAH
jgi:hypothetical protein